MSNKLRILFNTEASFLSSGFANYTRELLSRLYETGKYELAELASYGFVNDPRDSIIKWNYYANSVKKEDPRFDAYNSSSDNQFGKWRFDKTVLDFKPHVVIDVRDYWMSSYVKNSPLRNRFHWILMPTVDSAPQQESWLDTFLSADAIFTYSDWGARVLMEQTRNKINYIDTVSPGVNLNVFRQLDRKNIRNFFDIKEDAIILGSVMRNQKRKLIPELISSFRQSLDAIKDKSIKSRLFLYLHSSYPDMGWDIPELLKEHGVSNKVLFTYRCQTCNKITCRTFAGTQIVCQHCLNRSCSLSSVTNGVTEEELCLIYNIFDLYIQYSICEGFGMPQVEAGACGIPICSVKYSAMEDIIDKLNAYPIEASTYFKEMETKAIRVYPNNKQLIDYIVRFVSTPQEMIDKKRTKVRNLTHKHYNWEHIASKWQKYLDSLDVEKLEKIQSHQLKRYGNIANDQQNIANISSIINIVKNHEYLATKLDMGYLFDLLKSVDYGFEQLGSRISSFDMSKAIAIMNSFIEYNNTIKMIEDNQTYKTEDFIQYAHLKSSI